MLADNIELYFDYIDGTPAEIAQFFHRKDYYISKGYSEKDAARKVYSESNPSADSIIPWMKTQNEEIGIEDEFSLSDEEYDDYSDEDDFFFQKGRKGNSRANYFANSYKPIKLGAKIEVWKKTKLHQLIINQRAESIECKEFGNAIEVISAQELAEKFQQTSFIYVEELNLRSIKTNLPLNAEAIVMDPPIGYGMKFEELVEIFKFMKNNLQTAIIFIWLDNKYVTETMNAAIKAKLYKCDIIACELKTPTCQSVNIEGIDNLKTNSKMCAMFRTIEKLKRYEIAQQRYKDTGWGIVRKNGKSRSRYSTPQIPHEIAEKLLPPKQDKNRVFVELWPSRLCPRAKWIFIDEKK